LQEFRTKTEPLGAFYKKVSILHRIDGNRDRDAVFAEISRLIEDKTPK
jgi:adenylate kinase family enzyme